MIKGRRTRNADKNAAMNYAKPVLEDTASPKRKDAKYDNKGQTSSASAQLNKKPLPNAREPIVLRGGRLKNVDISRYMQQKTFSAVESVTLSRVDTIIDITDENTDDTCTAQPSDSKDVLISAETESMEASSSFNNNIFLQEPVLSLNFDKSLAQPTVSFVPLKILQKPFLSNHEIKTSLFSTPSQPRINCLWKKLSMSPLIENLKHQALDLSKPTQVTHIDSTTSTIEMSLHHDDSNSCDSGDSGVVILAATDSGTSSRDKEAETRLVMIANQNDSPEKRKKPATPHRILCPSPIKHAVDLPSSISSETKSSASGHNKNAAQNKTRKRLNLKVAENATTQKAVSPMNGLEHLPSQYDEIDTLPLHEELGTAISNKLTQGKYEFIVQPTTAKSNSTGNKKITEFYPVRRSVRKTKKEVQVERDRNIERAIREGREEGLKIEHFEGKGRGIITTRPFSKGEFVVEYMGDLVSVLEAKQREQSYAEDDNTGCYMYYFKHKNQQYCIDATAESGKLGRLVNHSRYGNLLTKTVSLNNRPHLVLIAKEDIEKGVEVTYDYGDRSKEALQYYPWLAL